MRRHPLRGFDEDSMFEAIQDDEFCICQSLGYLSVQAGIAAAVEFARRHEAGHFDFVQPRRHFGLGVDAEDIKKYLRICLDELALARGYARRLLLHRFVRETAPPPRISRECPGGRPEMRHHLIGKSMHHLKRLTGALALAARCQDLVDAKLSIDRQPGDELGAGANEKGSRRVPPAFA